MKKNKKEKFEQITKILYIVAITLNIVLAVLIYIKIIDKVKCPKDYDLDGEYCVRTIRQAASKELYCDIRYELVDGNCQRYEVLDISINHTCPDGYTMNGNYCEKVFTEKAKTKYICPDGYVTDDKECIKKEYIKKD